MELSVLQKITIGILPLLFAITFHEVAHGYVAYLCGDKTAKYAGRLSLNPAVHIDLLGTLVLPIISLMIGGILFGWAKPVPIEPKNFKHKRRDLILVSLAGSVANLLMAFAWAFLAKFTFSASNFSTGGPLLALHLMGQFGITINLFILLFNLLPIPPLDGSQILAALLKPATAYRYQQIAPYGIFILFALIFIGALNTLIGIPFSILHNLINLIVGLP